MLEIFERKTGTLFVTLLVIVSNHLCDAHKKGAPVLSCNTMVPGHGYPVQTTPPPYNVSVVSPDLGNGHMRIRLASINSNTYFTGFLLRDKLVLANGEDSSSLHGTFIAVPQDASIFDCSGSKSSAVTHKSDSKKRSVEVDYQPPRNFEGSVIFRATFVYNYTMFWTGVESLPIQIGSRNARQFPPSSNFDANGNDPQINSAIFSVYSGCGQAKNCLSYPENCINSKSCDAVVAVTSGSSDYEIEMFAKQAKYIAAGFSDDEAMGGDYVFECVNEGNSVKAHQSWNEPRRKANTRLEDTDDFNLINGLLADGIVYCKMRINSVIQYTDRRLDLNNEQYYLFLAAGSETSRRGPGVGYHDIFQTKSKVRRYLSDVIADPLQDSFYNGCNSVKTCFGVPEDCIERQNCNVVTTVAVQGNRFLINMQAKSAAYVATGLSDDQQMGSDHVIECVLNGSVVEAYSSWNVPNRKDNIRLGTNGIELVEGSYKEGNLMCKVLYDPTVIQGFRFDERYYVLLATGTALGPDKIGYHNLAYRASIKQVTLPSAAKGESFYQGCDRSKSCFGSPNGCIAQMNCEIGVAMSSEFGGRFVFHMIAEKSPAYVSVGLSEDNKMGDDIVFECVREDASGSNIKAFMSYNLPGQKANERLPRQNYLSLQNYSYTDGKIQCAIQLDVPTFNVRGKSYNLATDKYVILLAAGSSVTPSGPGSSGRVGYHDIFRAAADERRALADVSAIRGASKLLLHLHGSFMIASWIGLASLGIVVARYYKQTWVGSSCCGKDLWFFWHRFCMFLVVVLTIAGVVLIYIYSDGIVTGPGETHALLGFITAILAFLQPIGALFRPHPDSSRRPIFNWLHWLAGNSAHVVAIVTIFFAVDLGKAELPKWTDWILVTFVAYYVLVHLILSISGCMADKSGSMRINSMQMKDMNTGRNIPQQYERRKDAPQSCMRKFIMLLHFLIILAFSVFLILLIVYAPVKFS